MSPFWELTKKKYKEVKEKETTMPTTLWIILAMAVIFGVLGFMKAFKSKKVKNFIMVIAVIGLVYSLVGLAGSYGYVSLGNANGFFLATAGGSVLNPTTGTPTTSTVTTYQPTATYTAKDKFATTTVSGTSYYADNGNPATTTAKTSVNAGESYQYWVSNSTYWVTPTTKVASGGVNTFIADAFRNGTATLSIYDTTNRVSVTNGGSNITLGANGQANVELTYIGTSKQSAMPFGGVMVVEYNTTIASVTCSGADLTDTNPYHVTYSASSTSHAFKMYGVSSSLDDGTVSTGKKISCQFLNGATAQGNGLLRDVQFTFIPANYYISQTGAILLDTEKNADSDTTRTGSTINSPLVGFNWA